MGGTADKLALDLELSVRDYLNEGGKALVTGQYNQFAQAANGVYDYNPFAPPQCTTPDTYPCLPLFNDFLQYWLGAYNYVSDGGTGAEGPFPVSGASGEFDGFEGTFNGGDSADNQGHTASLLATSSFLPEADFPQFASVAPVKWGRPGAAPYDPHTGEWFMFSQWADQGWKRMTRTVDLTSATSGELSFQLSHDTELDWDYVVVEAHEVGTDDWTTLPDGNGHTQLGTGESCAAGWVDIHPFVAHYQGADCSPTGTTGEWHAATGNSAGWQEWNVDLSAYAGTAGRGVDQLPHRLGHPGSRRLRRRHHGPRRRGGHRGDLLRGRPRRLDPGTGARGIAGDEQLDPHPEGLRGGRRHHDRGHRVHGLRRGGPDDGGDAPRLRRPGHGPPPGLIAPEEHEHSRPPASRRGPAASFVR